MNEYSVVMVFVSSILTLQLKYKIMNDITGIVVKNLLQEKLKKYKVNIHFTPIGDVFTSFLVLVFLPVAWVIFCIITSDFGANTLLGYSEWLVHFI